MKRTFRRLRHLYIFAGLVGAVAIINILFFLILYRPARSEYVRLQESISRLRAERLMRQRQVEQKERIAAQLETSGKDRFALVTKHFIPKNVGYAQIVPELDGLVARTGVRKTTVNFSTDETPRYGLSLVKSNYPVQGNYPNVVNFIKQLESSETFYIITQVDVRTGGDNSFQPNAGNIVLALNLETYIYQ